MMRELLQNRKNRSAATIICVFGFYFISMCYFLIARYENNYSRFLHISAKNLEKNPFVQNRNLIVLDDPGYDGQMFYFMAHDPFLTKLDNAKDYRNVVDLPVFRYRRIGFVLLTYFLALGNPEWYPAIMVWLILLSHAAGAFFLIKIAIAYGRDPLWGLLYILIPGYAFSIMYALPESIAGAMLLAGFYFYHKERTGLATALFAVSVLFRETGLLLIGLIGLFDAYRTKNLAGAIRIWISAIPYLLWRFYVTWQLSPDSGWSGFFLEPPNLTIPFSGIAAMWIKISQGDYLDYIRAAGIVFPILLVGAATIGIAAFRTRPTPQSIALFCYASLALSLNYQKVWLHVANVERQSYESFLCLLLVFLSTAFESSSLKKIFALYFPLLFLYDFLISASDVSFRALLHLAQYLF